jgi:acetyl/propionyl-CoA carboxylase alpha subunit
VDTGVECGSLVGLEYDALLAKLVVLGPDRRAAIERARRAAAEWVVIGVETNMPLLQAVLASKEFASGRYSTELIPRLPERKAPPIPDAAWIAAALALGASAEPGLLAHRSEPWDDSSAWRPGQ